jgi:chromosome segregation ATPase
MDEIDDEEEHEEEVDSDEPGGFVLRNTSVSLRRKPEQQQEEEPEQEEGEVEEGSELDQLEEEAPEQLSSMDASGKKAKKKRMKLALERIDKFELQLRELKQDRAQNRRNFQELTEGIVVTNNKIDLLRKDLASNEISMHQLSNSIEALDSRLEGLAGEITECTQRLGSIQVETEKKLSGFEAQVNEMQKLVNSVETESELEKVNRSISDLRQELERRVEANDSAFVRSELKKLDEELNQRMDALEKSGRESLAQVESDLSSFQGRLLKLVDGLQTNSLGVELITKDLEASSAKITSLGEEWSEAKRALDVVLGTLKEARSRNESLENSITKITLRLDQVEKDNATIFRKATAFEQL